MTTDQMDHEISRRLHRAVEQLEPVPRLHDATARPSRRPIVRRSFAIGTAAAITVAVVLGVVAINASDAPDRLRTEATNPVPASTTTTSSVRVGGRLTIDESTLPLGMVLVDDRAARTGYSETWITSFSADAGLWRGDRPYLRLVANTEPGLGTAALSDLPPGSEPVSIGRRQGWAGPDGAPLDQPQALTDNPEPWFTVLLVDSPDRTLAVQGWDIDPDDLTAIAATLRYE